MGFLLFAITFVAVTWVGIGAIMYYGGFDMNNYVMTVLAFNLTVSLIITILSARR